MLLKHMPRDRDHVTVNAFRCTYCWDTRVVSLFATKCVSYTQTHTYTYLRTHILLRNEMCIIHANTHIYLPTYTHTSSQRNVYHTRKHTHIPTYVHTYLHTHTGKQRPSPCQVHDTPRSRHTQCSKGSHRKTRNTNPPHPHTPRAGHPTADHAYIHSKRCLSRSRSRSRSRSLST